MGKFLLGAQFSAYSYVVEVGALESKNGMPGPINGSFSKMNGMRFALV
jgi:hypothetical protein